MSQNPDSVTLLSPAFSRCRSNKNPARRETIAVIVMMDNAEATIKHFRSLLDRAAPNAEVIFCRMACAEDDLHKEEPHYFKDETKYLLSNDIPDWHQVVGIRHVDEVIVTGINRGSLSYEELETEYPLFWDEFSELMGKIDESTKSGMTGHSLLICWAAIAAAKVWEGVDKNIYPQKLYGVYDHQVVQPRHDLLKGLDGENFRIPHSRVSYMDENILTGAIERSNGQVILRGPDGPTLWTIRDDRIACIIAHPEYGESTLKNEFERDTDKLREKTKNPNALFHPPYDYEYGSQKTNDDFGYLKEIFCPVLYRNLVELAAQRKNEANARLEIERDPSPGFKGGLRHLAFWA